LARKRRLRRILRASKSPRGMREQKVALVIKYIPPSREKLGKLTLQTGDKSPGAKKKGFGGKIDKIQGRLVTQEKPYIKSRKKSAFEKDLKGHLPPKKKKSTRQDT